MDRHTLRRMYNTLRELERVERTIKEWEKALADPNTRYGPQDTRSLKSTSQRVQVILELTPEYSYGQGHSLRETFWNEASIRKALELFLGGLRSSAHELREDLRSLGVDPDTEYAGSHLDEENFD